MPFRTITISSATLSSAYAIVSYLFDAMRRPSNSLMTRTNSNGENTSPCGVPLLTNLLIFGVEVTILPVSSELINFINRVFIFSLDSADVIADKGLKIWDTKE